MRAKKTTTVKKTTAALFISVLAIALFALTVPLFAQANGAANDNRVEQYRPQLSYSPLNNWNNDPNGLLYVGDEGGGTYHMYYQYATTGNRWDAMHWGHAVSSDLVHWTEKDVAISPLWGYVPGSEVPTGPIFSGSAVYVSAAEAADKTNPKSKAYNGAGFYAIFTQPKTAEERDAEAETEGTFDQRQSIAYSADGDFFDHSTFREILPTANNFTATNDAGESESIGLKYPGDFRDPKVFFNEQLGKWIMTVGGGEIVQFVSENLLDWEYIGTTGFWGECPDLFPLGAPEDGDQTWVLLLSPEDKMQSHEFNGTTRLTHEYPNEYYVLGTCDQNGLFRAYEGETLRQFSFGIDSYAVQTFNDAPSGKRYGVSWAANWKTVDDYALAGAGGLRDCWNGGMTMVYELDLETVNGERMLTKNPVSGYESLRGEQLYGAASVTLGGNNPLEGISASVAEADITLFVADGVASTVTLTLAQSDYEQTLITYDTASQTLTVDRSKSSLAAQNTARYRVPYTALLAPEDGKVRIRAYLDWGSVSVYGGKGEVSANVAIFPSLHSRGMSLVSTGDAVTADVSVYALEGIWNNDEAAQAFDGFYLSAKDKSLHVGETLSVLACSPSAGFDANKVVYTTQDDTVGLTKNDDGSLTVRANKVGRATVTADYGAAKRTFNVTVYSGKTQSDVLFESVYAGKWVRDGGYTGSAGGDGFVYSNEKFTDFSVQTTVTARSDNAAAFGIVFAAGNNYHTYYCANYDYAAGQVKIWMSGGDTVAAAPLKLRRGDSAVYRLTVIAGDMTVEVNGVTVLETYHGAYESGYLGLNVFGGEFAFDGITVSPIYGADGTAGAEAGDTAFTLRNQTLKSYLTAQDYTVADGFVTLTDAYISSLEGGKSYEFMLMLEDGGKKTFTVRTHAALQIFDSYRVINNGSALTLALLLGQARLSGVTLDGEAVEYAFENDSLLISEAALNALADGDHEIRIITDRGSATFVFGFEFVSPPPVDNTGAIISVISAALLLCVVSAFAVYWLVFRKQKKTVD